MRRPPWLFEEICGNCQKRSDSPQNSIKAGVRAAINSANEYVIIRLLYVPSLNAVLDGVEQGLHLF